MSAKLDPVASAIQSSDSATIRVAFSCPPNQADIAAVGYSFSSTFSKAIQCAIAPASIFSFATTYSSAIRAAICVTLVCTVVHTNAPTIWTAFTNSVNVAPLETTFSITECSADGAAICTTNDATAVLSIVPSFKPADAVPRRQAFYPTFSPTYRQSSNPSN